MSDSRAAEKRFRDLYEAYAPDVYTYFRRRCDDPRDCTADAFLVAWRRLDDVPEGEAALRWLYGVSRKVLLNHRRSRARRLRLTAKLAGTAEPPDPEPDLLVVQRVEDAEVLAALNRLSAADQELLRLATWEELPHAAIGEILGCSAHAVDQRIYRATRRLAREMGRTGHIHAAGTTPGTETRGGYR